MFAVVNYAAWQAKTRAMVSGSGALTQSTTAQHATRHAWHEAGYAMIDV